MHCCVYGSVAFYQQLEGKLAVSKRMSQKMASTTRLLETTTFAMKSYTTQQNNNSRRRAPPQLRSLLEHVKVHVQQLVNEMHAD